MKKAGSALITNTMICQAARFVANPSDVLGAPIDAFFDFSTLVEAVILRDSLYSIDGDLVGYSSNCENLPLVTFLAQENILSLKKIPINPDNAKRAIISVVGPQRAFAPVKTEIFQFSIADFVPQAFPDESNRLVASKNFPEGDRSSFMALMSHPKASTRISDTSNAFEFFQGNNFLNMLRGTGDTQRGAYSLRTFLYSQAAQDFRITFMPDYARLPILESVLDNLYKNLILDGYSQITKKLEVSAEDFLQDAAPLGLPIPPFTSILLGRCNSRSDVIRVLLEMRWEFRRLRESIINFEETLISSTNIKDRIKAKKEIESTFQAVAKRYDSSGLTKLKKALDFAGDLARPAYNWTNPTAYRSSLLTQPIDWVSDWWRRRPLVQLFDVFKEFESIRNYNLLVNKIFEIEFSPDEIDNYRRARELLAKCFTTSEVQK